MFTIDLSKYRLVDLAITIDPDNQPAGRPFKATRSRLPDTSFKHDVETHTHVGAHVEAPAHFFDGGKDLTAFPITTFATPAALVDINLPPSRDTWITPDLLEREVGSILQPGWTLFLRNTSDATRSAVAKDVLLGSLFREDAAEWMRDKKIAALAFDYPYVDMGRTDEEGLNVHDILLGADILLIEGLDNLHALTRKKFFLLWFPVKVRKIDSSWTRPVAIEEI